MNKKELQAFVRRDFALFIERSFAELNSQTEYQHNFHIEVIADALEQCRTGKLKRLIINLPPRSLKSQMASIAFPAYLLGHKPSTQIICASYAQDLADKLAGDCRSLMTSKWYEELFPSTRLAARRSALSDYATTARGFRLSTSVGGVLTGRGADFIVIDDPLKPDEALSETQRKSVNEWYDHSLITRLNDKKSGCVILIMQRLHEDDLVGHVLQKEDWKIIKFPAIAEENTSYTIRTLYGEKTFSRKVGDALHPEREPLEVLAQIREILGEYHFAGQYQQAPSPLGGGMIQTDWFKFYTPEELPREFDLVFQSWDTANKSSELNDYSACTTWGVRKDHLYLLDVFRKRLDYPDLRTAVKELALLYEAKNILIEDKASGTQLLQDLQNDGVHGATAYATSLDKIMRAHSVSSTIKSGFVYIPAHADWLPEYLHEFAAFPKGKYDDQVDSTSQALDWSKQGMGRLGYIELLKQIAARGGVRAVFGSGNSRRGLERISSDQQSRKNDADLKPLAQIESRPCEGCGGTMTQRIAGGLRCMQCAAQWLHPDHRPRISSLSRADVLNSVGRFR